MERIRKLVGLSVTVLEVGQTATGHINEAVLIMNLSWVVCWLPVQLLLTWCGEQCPELPSAGEQKKALALTSVHPLFLYIFLLTARVSSRDNFPVLALEKM